MSPQKVDHYLIALLLSYFEHSAFTRSYRQWTGMTPQQARHDMSTGA